MAYPLSQTLATLLLIAGAEGAAQPDIRQLPSPWEPQPTSVLFLKGRSGQAPPVLHVAGRVATTLVFDESLVASAALGGDTDQQFARLEVGTHSVVLIPKRDLAEGERLSLTVTLKDGTELPFVLVTPASNRSTHGQVDVLVEDTGEAQRALEICRVQRETLTAQVAELSGEEGSVDGALATLLAQGHAHLTPFAERHQRGLQTESATIKVVTYAGRNRKIPLGKAAVVINVTNNAEKPWELDEIRLNTEPYDFGPRPFAMRASARTIAPGKTGSFAVVMSAEALKSGPDVEYFVLELWRTGVPRPDRELAVELVAVDDPSAPLQFPRRPGIR